MKRWEYRELNMQGVAASDLNEYGADGWELVCVTPYPGEGVYAYFKRELPAEKPVSGEEPCHGY